jgi:hypothetical protein
MEVRITMLLDVSTILPNQTASGRRFSLRRRFSRIAVLAVRFLFIGSMTITASVFIISFCWHDPTDSVVSAEDTFSPSSDH